MLICGRGVALGDIRDRIHNKLIDTLQVGLAQMTCNPKEIEGQPQRSDA